jgi:uncharacterized lipoprotein YehR (DUF1307 family)
MNKIRKILSAVLCLVMVVSLCACGKDAEPDQTDKTSLTAATTSRAADSNTKISLELPEGWKAVEGSVLEHQYMKNTASLMIKNEAYTSDTLSGVADEAETILSGYFNEFQTLGERENIKVGGKDALKMSFSCKVSSFNMGYTYIFLFLDGEVCVISFGDLSGTFDEMTADIAYILEHMTFSAR